MCLRSDILNDKIEQRLSICGVQERFSPITIPNSFCFETCLILVFPTFNSRWSVPFNRFLALNNMYVVLSKLMGNLFRLLQYMIYNRSSEISPFIVSISVLLVCTVASSANKSQKQCFKKRGKSFTNRRNNVGPNIDPCGTPDCIFE